jgi:hypothetical protein
LGCDQTAAQGDDLVVRHARPDWGILRRGRRRGRGAAGRRAPANLSGASGPGGGGELEEYSAARGAARLAQGDARGTLAKAAGGLAAPVASAVRQLAGLAEDVLRSAAALNPRRGGTESVAAHVAPSGPPRRRKPAEAAASSAA